VSLVWDGPHVLELLRLAAASTPGAPWAAGLLAALLGLGLLALAVRWCWASLARCLAWRGAWPIVLGAVAALSLSFFAYVPEQRDTRWFFSLPVAPTLQRHAVLLARLAQPQQADRVLGPSPAFDGSLQGLRSSAHAPGGLPGASDVLLLFAESYGAVCFDQPALAAALAPARAALADALAARGLGVVSARVRSPTYGGSSWLAHASVLSGLSMDDPSHYELLLAGQRPTLVTHFARHGYRTVGWMPGLKRPWPEGAFYGFDRLADDAQLGYAGPDFGFWRIPDQAAMALLHAQELAPGAALPGAEGASPRPPRFAVFATTSTHAPFHPLAPLVADAQRLTRPDAYSAEDLAAALAVPAGLDGALPRYLQAMRYQYGWLAQYLQQHAAPGLVLVIVGDHQPPALVSGPAANWDVPVHVISGQPGVLQRLQALGFAPGLPLPAASLGPMDRLTGWLLQAFEGPAARGGAPGGAALGAAAGP
jgi:hypothetical protein